MGVRQFGQVLENPTLSETLVPLVPCLPEVRWTHLIEFRARDLKLARPLIFVLLIAAERRRKRTWCSRRLLREFVFADLSSHRLARNRTSTCWAATGTWRDAECFLLSWLLPELLEPGVEFIFPEEQNPVDLVRARRLMSPRGSEQANA